MKDEKLILDKEKENGIHIFIDKKIPLELEKDIKKLIPWRKGPFFLHFSDKTLFIDSEWKSYIKLKLILELLKNQHFDTILDVGCNNGFYIIALCILFKNSYIIGIDPVSFFQTQFNLISRFLSFKVDFRLEELKNISNLGKFELILCLGVLYHRNNPFECLKILKNALKDKSSLLILETLIIKDSNLTLIPAQTYAGMSNVYFIFSVNGFINLAKKAGFTICELMHYSFTTKEEQRSTNFAPKSLGDTLYLDNTVEGYQKPCRGIFQLKK